jgi:hypothetical protein
MPDYDSGVVVCSSDLLSCGNTGRRQTENPLIPLSSFARPPLCTQAIWPLDPPKNRDFHGDRAQLSTAVGFQASVAE